MRMENVFGELHYHHRRTLAMTERDRTAWIERHEAVDSIEHELHGLPKDTQAVNILGDLCRDHRKTLWLFPPAVTSVSFEEVHDLEAALQGLPLSLRSLEIMSTFSLSLGDSLLRFPKLRHFSVQSPNLELHRFPETLEVLELDVYSVCLSNSCEDDDFNLLHCKALMELSFAEQCDFNCIGDLVLPSSMQYLKLNETCTAEILCCALLLNTIVVHESYLHLDKLDPEIVCTYY